MATVSKWPTHAWTLLLESVLVGKAREAYSVLSIEGSKDYEKVKGAILRTYELDPEAYRQRKKRRSVLVLGASHRSKRLRKILDN